VNCPQVRDVLPEYALGVAGDVATEVDRHLEWCAACRREARELQHAAATVAFALEPDVPGVGLEQRVVRSVAEAAEPHRVARSPRRRLMAVLVAAAFVVASLGWGAVMAGRAARLEDQAARDAERTQLAIQTFRDMFRTAFLVDRGTTALLGVLEPREGFDATGSALSILSPSVDDRVIVIVSGLPDRAKLFPYRVSLSDGRGRTVPVGQIDVLDGAGGANLGRITGRALDDFVDVVVRDARGRVVLHGALAVQAPVASPSVAASRP
jgi:hypothetical protein